MELSPFMIFIFLTILGVFFWNLASFCYNYLAKHFFPPEEPKLILTKEKIIYKSQPQYAVFKNFSIDKDYNDIVIRGGRGIPKTIKWKKGD